MIFKNRSKEKNSKNIEPIKSVHWKITRVCNYNCSYCISNLKKSIKHYPLFDDSDPSLILDKLARNLTGNWDFHFDGSGEPFLARNFLEIVGKLIKMGHRVGVITNFSAPLKQILKFCEITAGKLLYFNASLHLECIEPKKFLKKALLVKEAIGDKFRVVSVAKKNHVAELSRIGEIFQKKNIRFYIQPQRDYSTCGLEDPFVKYNKQELDIVEKSRGFFVKKNLEFRGKMCWAGSKYFIINERGRAWRCQPALKLGCKKDYLGNLLEGTFKLNKGPSKCRYKYCVCPDPVFLGMIIDDQLTMNDTVMNLYHRFIKHGRRGGAQT